MKARDRIRPPAVAGMFYPADPQELARQVDAYVAAAPAGAAAEAPKAVVVPHAGYVYSGPVAGFAYARLKPVADRVRRVVIVGPAHRGGVDGVALPGTDEWDTPLGRVEVDRDAVALIAGLPQVVESASVHAREHSLEVQLPFVQRVLPGARVLPLAVGWSAPDAVAEVLEAIWGGPETRIVVSSDLSHYLPYDRAREVDRATADRVLALDPAVPSDAACGALGIDALALVARRRGLHPALLDLRSSGDTAGPRDRVVGYGAFTFSEASP